MNPNNTSWSDHEVRILITMCREEGPYQDIAQTLGRTLSAVTSKVSNLRSAIDKQPDPVAPVYAPRPGQNRAQRLTASFFGDPPLGRSALDQRTQQ
ncbi:hypothetical protein [Devosia naphthalenivorans]|uniref:hypothetical protein n=1 Tax=Devosia naphthalenivorans TaxID=2082392 RepID=UPI000D3B3DCD|nr:hypothetical protein [Devosia naphthalenivorans]